MQKEELRQLLNQPYKTDTWKQITDFVFPNVSYLQKPQDIPIPSRFQKISDSFKQMGNVRLNDGKNLAIFEVHVADNVNISSNRVQLRELVAGLIDQERNHGVLVIYEQGKEDYRFTFTAKSTEFDEEASEFVNLETDAKRYTYILGKNESCRTAVNRFWELKDKKDSATIKDVEQAFSVERLNKDFFNRYKEFYESFVQYITGKRFVKEKGKWVEKTIDTPNALHKKVFKSEDKLARNFVKLLLGRIVFIQFLQKKGWMGVPASSKKWENGDKDFIYTLFKNCKDKSSFHSKSLFPLFYEAFNTAGRANDIFPLTNSRVPYLNGGLFENEYPESHKIDFPEKMFEELLEFFSQYNFTIDENDPFDHEVGIDPEMLGHIFENLLEDNKDKGAFYTPKPIVQYMCQESLKEYLCTYLKENKQWPTDKVKAEKLDTDIQNFVRKKEAAEIIDYDEHLATALMFVKVCDPAIGSGAFPMGILNEIYYCIQVLHNVSPETVEHIWQMNDWRPDIVKKNIIQHSIYGVDIEKGAVDIARLRFWLSLIVDEKAPYPLPNLDFKIMQGNSLLESYEGIDLSNIGGAKGEISNVEVDLFGEPKNKQSSIFDTTYIEDSNITELIVEYFNAQKPDIKQELKKTIDEIIHRHIDFNLEIAEKKVQVRIDDLELRLSLIKINKSDPKAVYEKNVKSKERLIKSLDKEKVAIKNLKAKRKELHELQNKTERPYFLWHLFFKDVLDKGGFDIIIGNPPYVQLQKMGKQCDDLQRVGFDTFERTGDLYCLFYEIGIELLRKNGVLTYITSNKWMRAAYGEALRKYFIEKANPTTLIDFGGYQVFETATVDTNIIIIQKNNFLNETQTCVLGRGFSLKNMSDYFRQNFKVASFDSTRSWVVLSTIEEGIRSKIERAGTPLKDWDIKIYRGVLTGYNEAFIIDSEKRMQLIKASPNSDEIIRPILLGRNIKKYSYEWENLWIINAHNGIKSKGIPPINIQKDYPAVFQHLLKFEKQLRARLDQGDHWTNLRNCAYIEDFDNPKIAWGNLALVGQFCFIPKGFFINAPSPFFMTDNYYLLAVLNSSVSDYYIKRLGVSRSGGYFEYKPMFIEQLPIPNIGASEQEPFKRMVQNIIKSKNNGENIKGIEAKLDEMVFDLYGLNSNEKNVLINHLLQDL